ncbi:MAG: hypothetical protein JWN52_818 [Actinomycetia bacterium]|nr:hypothetical protein [Actinomycetes bacterium]
MNTIEERLHDALAAVGEIVRPEDVPSLEPSPRRGFAVSRFAAVAIAASLAVVMVATIVVLRPDHSGSGNRPGFVGPAKETQIADVAIFLCNRKSSNLACGKSEATAKQLSSLKKELMGMPQVRTFWYESKDEAYQRFKQRFASQPGFLSSTKEGDISSSFRVDLARQGDFRKVVERLIGRPGVDRIVDLRRGQ